MMLQNGESWRTAPDYAVLIEHYAKRDPDEWIGNGRGSDLLHKWKMGPGAYLHHFLRDDPDDLHDHPWPNTSIILHGGYWEDVAEVPKGGDGRTRITRSHWRPPGSIISRTASDAHRIRLNGGVEAWSIFLTGEKVREEWGFHRGPGLIEWIPWHVYIAKREGSLHIGRISHLPDALRSTLIRANLFTVDRIMRKPIGELAAICGPELTFDLLARMKGHEERQRDEGGIPGPSEGGKADAS